jgi:hypothetical protein
MIGQINKFDLKDQVKCFYGNHRSGWSFAVSNLCDLHDSNSIYLDTFIERTYVWGQKSSSVNQPYIPDKEWVGIIHVPPFIPSWFDQGNSNEEIFALSTWQKSFRMCRGIFTLSEYHKIFIEKMLDVPVDVLFHPMEIPDKKWSFDLFLKNSQKKIVQIGWWLRNLHAIFELPISNYRKVFLKPKKSTWFDTLMENERKIRIRLGKFRNVMYESVEHIDFLPNNHYDELLSKNIVFVYLYDASANNAVVECLARNTPLLINKIPPVVEYLGLDYPFYYSSYEEAIEKANSFDLVYSTHAYLKSLTLKNKLTPEYFRNSILNSHLLKE